MKQYEKPTIEIFCCSQDVLWTSNPTVKDMIWEDGLDYEDFI